MTSNFKPEIEGPNIVETAHAQWKIAKILRWRVTFCGNICGTLDGGMVVLTTTLLLEVFTQRNFVADFDWNWISFKKQKLAFWATLCGTQG